MIFRCLSYLCLISSSLAIAGCCRTYEPNPPSRPTQVDGWKTVDQDYFQTIGSFVLTPGDSTENGKLGITLIALKPRKLCPGPLAEPSPGEIKLRFYRPSDKQVLCETTIFAIGDRGGGTLDCVDKSELPSGYSVRAMNYK